MDLLSAGAGANQGLDDYLKRLMEEQQEQRMRDMLTETSRHNVAAEGLQGRQIDSIDADRKSREAETMRQNNLLESAKARDDGRMLGDVIKPGTELLDNDPEVGQRADPAVGQMQAGGVGSLLKPHERRPAVDVGPLLEGDDGGARLKGFTKLESSAQENTRVDNETAQGRLKQDTADLSERERHDRAMEAKPSGMSTVVYPGADGPLLIDKRAGTSRPVTAPGGDGNVPLAPTTADRNLASSRKRVMPIIEGITELSARINTKPGMAALFNGGLRELRAKAMEDDDVAEYMALIDSFMPLLARAEGHTGVLTELDVQHAIQILPKPGDSDSLRERKLARLQKILGLGDDGGGQQGGIPQVGGTFNGGKVLKVTPLSK